MMTKLTAHPYANCTIYANGNTIRCISYTTEVATIENGWLTIHGLYSATTRRHIGSFVKEYAGLTYATAKRLYEDGYRYNVTTGEIAP